MCLHEYLQVNLLLNCLVMVNDCSHGLLLVQLISYDGRGLGKCMLVVYMVFLALRRFKHYRAECLMRSSSRIPSWWLISIFPSSLFYLWQRCWGKQFWTYTTSSKVTSRLSIGAKTPPC